MDFFKSCMTIQEWVKWEEVNRKSSSLPYLPPFEYWLNSFLNDKQKFALNWFICEQTEIAQKRALEEWKAHANSIQPGPRPPVSLYGFGGGDGMIWEISNSGIGMAFKVTNWYTGNSLDFTDLDSW